MMKIYKDCFNNKVVDVLNAQEKGGKAVLLFNHGLGDFILFLPLFEELRNRFENGLNKHNWELYIGCNPERNFKQIYNKCVIMDAPYGKYEEEYDIIFNIVYPEPPRTNNELTNFNSLFYVPDIKTISKPYLCNYLEIGLENFEWKPYDFVCISNSNSNLIGIHFFGHTSVQNKDAEILKLNEAIKDLHEANNKLTLSLSEAQALVEQQDTGITFNEEEYNNIVEKYNSVVKTLEEKNSIIKGQEETINLFKKEKNKNR